MKTNQVREKLRAGKPSLGCFVGLGSPNAAELLAHAGLEWLVIETEHSALDSAEIEHMLMAVNGTDAVPVVRVPSADPVFIQRALDYGALGVMVPMVKTAEEARAIVRATRYPPAGTRGYNPLRAAHYSFDSQDYFYRANDNLLVCLILETKEAVENMEAIAAVPGVDVLFLGPFDLCLSLGLDPMKQPHPEINAVIERMLAISKKSGVSAGIHVFNPDQLEQRRSQGFTMISYSTDYGILAEAAKTGLAAFHRKAQS
ncbi:MAG: aldolase/citrate lyase family protein [Terriglobia bacterium]